jgi:hypothetical protein
MHVLKGFLGVFEVLKPEIQVFEQFSKIYFLQDTTKGKFSI